MKKLKIGFIGCGGIAFDKHLPGMATQTDKIDMYAFCDIIAERAEEARQKYGCTDAKMYTDYHELLEDPEIYAVHVLTPNVKHCEISCAAMEAGKHVICEKPMAATAADAKKMLDTSKRTGKLLTIGYQYRHFDANRAMKDYVSTGALGDIYYAETTAIRRRGIPTWGVFTNKAEQGGGPLIDIATHSLDLTLWMMNNYEVESVTGVSFAKIGKYAAPDEMGNDFGAWDPAKYEVEDSADLIFFHPPYHNMIQYSGNIWGTPHPDDLSRCENYSDFLEKLNHCIRKFFLALRKGGRLAILVGDMRLHGKFYSMQNDLMRMGDFESFLVKGQFNCVSDNRTYKKPFIPIVTEYALLLKKTDSFIIPFSIRQEGVFSVQNTDILALTWHHLIRMTMESIGGRGALKDLYALLKEHPKAKKNPHYQERIRATLYEHPDEYIPVSKGYFRLSYPVT